MRNNNKSKIFAAALLVALAASASYAQAPRQTAPNQGAPLDVIALQTYVEGRSETYGVKPAEAIPVNPGDRVRIHLVGTAIINGNGVERRIPARFSVAAGKGHIDIVQTGPDWALVQVNSRGDGLAQLGYEVTGNNYEMKSGLRDGRITLQIGDGPESSPGSLGNVDRVRWDRARDLTDQLYRSILGVAPQGDVAQKDLEHIYEMGALGVRDVALALADDANSRFDRLSQDDAVDVLGDLYRGLLRRPGSDDQLWDQDPGFRTNVDTLQRQGYEKIVQVILDAPEFRTANALSEFGSLAGLDHNPDWRSDRSRYAIRDN
jgi:opacity protein-like surface antigen